MSAEASLGCQPGQSVAFVADEFARLLTGCLSDAAQPAVPLYRDHLFRQPVPVTTVADFWTLLFTPGYPPGTYTLFFAVTRAGDPARLLVWTTHAVEFTSTSPISGSSERTFSVTCGSGGPRS